MIRVAIADDRTLFREALVHLLGTRKTLQVTGAGTIADAPALLAEHQPDILLVAAPDGAVATTRSLPAVAGIRVIVIGGRDDSPARVLGAGAAGYLNSEASPDELVATITAVHAGEKVPSDAGEGTDPVEILSPRELETLRFLAAGQTNREIALRLGISVKTVDTHRGHVLKKLRLRNNSDLTRFAIQQGLVELGA